MPPQRTARPRRPTTGHPSDRTGPGPPAVRARGRSIETGVTGLQNTIKSWSARRGRGRGGALARQTTWAVLLIGAGWGLARGGEPPGALTVRLVRPDEQ